MINEMEKVIQLSSEQFEGFKKAKHLDKLFKKHVGLDSRAKYALGDTAVMIPNPEMYGIYRIEWKGKVIYYLIVSIMGPDIAFAWSLYPISEVSAC